MERFEQSASARGEQYRSVAKFDDWFAQNACEAGSNRSASLTGLLRRVGAKREKNSRRLVPHAAFKGRKRRATAIYT